jgi:predicted ATPase
MREIQGFLSGKDCIKDSSMLAELLAKSVLILFANDNPVNSVFRSLFRDVLSQMQQGEEESDSSRYSSAEQVDCNGDDLSMSSKSSTKSNYISSFHSICRKINAPSEIAEVVGRRFLGLRERNKHDTTTGSLEPLDLQKIVDFLADMFIRCTKDVDLVFLVLDDVHWMDEMSWKVVETIFNRGDNMFTLCGSRPFSSNPLTIDPNFWSDLQGPQREISRYAEICLAPFTEAEVKELIADTLEFQTNEIDGSFSRNLFNTSGGMPHYLSYVLDNIKRSDLSIRLDTGMMGLKRSMEEETKVFCLRIRFAFTSFSLQVLSYAHLVQFSIPMFAA